MKTAIYIEDGTAQLVITPQSEFEKNALTTFRDKPLDAKLFAGSFYDCRGGWIRQNAISQNLCGFERSDDRSLILVAREGEPPDNMRQALRDIVALCRSSGDLDRAQIEGLALAALPPT